MKKGMSTRTKLLGGAMALLALAALSVAGAWFFVLSSDAPAAVSLQAALQSAGSSSGSGSGASDGLAAIDSADRLAGTWTAVANSASFVGYRVDETLAGFGATTAVGRTQTLQAQLSFDGDTITAVEVTADLTALASDKSMRDGQLRTQAIQTATYPTARFVLSSPIAISEVPADGETVTRTVAGQLTLHGVTQPVQLDVQGAMQGDQVVIVGSTEIEFADYGIEQPRSAAVLSIEDHGTVEFQLVFTKSAA